MRLQVSNSNQPNWHFVTVNAELPKELKPLEELSRNLWWVWNSRGKHLFRDLDPELWRKYGQNPVMLLQNLSYNRIEEIRTDKEWMTRIAEVYKEFRDYMSQPTDKSKPSVAYFSMEYGLCTCLKIYSGGLGVLAGDYIKQASDSHIDMTAVGFLYRYGYFSQSLSMDGHQIADYEAQNFNQLPLELVTEKDGSPVILEVPFPEHTVYCHIWRVNVGRMKLYLLDTDFEKNSEWDRTITHKLYGGDWENRMKQEYLLGIGGIYMLDRLGIKADIYHANEGHAALLNLQRLVNYVERNQLSFDVALEAVRASSLYTVHTPVPAGHDYFEESLAAKYLSAFPARLGISRQDLMNMGRENSNTNERFSMSVFALKTCQEANGVSWLHGEVSKRMFAGIWKGYSPQESHVGYVTNGVHMPTWAASEWKEFYKKYLGEQVFENQSDPKAWEKIFSIPDQEIWNMRTLLKNKFIAFVKSDFKEKWLKNQGDPSEIVKVLDRINPNALIIGFARRFATYKRAHLLFTDLDRLAKIVNNEQFPVQFVFSGKAHPADGAGQDLIKRIVEVSHMPQFMGKIFFLEDYNMTVAKRLVTGVDIWLNTPTRPLEASGTSGEKAEMNGVLNFSVLDGWWYEGYRFDEKAGWALTDQRTFADQAQQDKLDAATIYSMLENEIVPLYFRKNSAGYSPDWIQYIKRSIGNIAPHFTMKRQLDDYVSRFYIPEAKRSRKLEAHDFAKAREIVQWKHNVAEKWDSIQVLNMEVENQLPNGAAMRMGQPISFSVTLDSKGLGQDIAVELVVQKEKEGQYEFDHIVPFTLKNVEGDIANYTLKTQVKESGNFQLGLRYYPINKDLPYRQDFAYIHWF